MTKYLLFQFILEHLVYAWQQPSHSQALTHRIYIYIKKSTNNRIFSLFLHFVTRIQLPTATQKWDSKLGNISLQSPLEWFMLFHAVFHRKSASKAPGVITLTRSTAHKLVWQRKQSICEKTLLCTRTVGTPPTKHLICKWRKQCSSHNAHKHYRFHINIAKKCCIQHLANTDNKKESMVYLRQARHS